ncbi:MAG: ketoacyl-ACP synthase III [Sinimarinibacterium sp.]
METADLASALGVAAETLERRIGVRRMARKAPQQDSSHLCVAAAHKLFSAGLATRSQIECVIVVTQNPDGGGLPHTAALVHGALGLPDACAAFDLGLGCSGYVYGLSVAQSFMHANGYRCGLLFTSDPYSKIVDETDKRTAMLFGDAATVTLLSDRPQWHIGKFDFGTQGAQAKALTAGAGTGERRKLHMDGRAVLAFSVQQVPTSLKRAVAANGLTLSEIDRFVLHQGSRVVVENIAQRLDAVGRADFHAQDYGNAVSSSIPIVLADNLGPDDRKVAISGFGVGLSWASTVLERIN